MTDQFPHKDVLFPKEPDSSFRIIRTSPTFHPSSPRCLSSFYLSLWPQGLLYYSSFLLNSWDVAVNNTLFTLDCQFAVTAMRPCVPLLFAQHSLCTPFLFLFGNRGQEKATLNQKADILCVSAKADKSMFSLLIQQNPLTFCSKILLTC